MKKDISFIKQIMPCVLALLTSAFVSLSAENISAAPKKGTVTGKVTTENGKPLQGASVVIKGTTTGTVSDIEGSFVLKSVADNSELQVSYVGFKTATLKPDLNQPLNIRMEISIQQVQGVTINPAPDNEPLSAIDDEFGIRIRGIDDNNPPLYVLDGKEISRSDFNNLDANKIGSISVLKDEPAVEKYGEKGKNGVILITTKVSLPPVPSLGLGSITLPSDEKRKVKKPVFTIVEQMPQFPGGEKRLVYYLSEYTKYPPRAKANKIEGTVVANFVVSQTGRVMNVRVAKSADPALDDEAVRAVSSMPNWTPGKQNGIPVDVSYSIPIEFKLQNAGKGTSDAESSEMEDLQNQMTEIKEQISDHQTKISELQKISTSAQTGDNQKQITDLRKKTDDLQKQLSASQRQITSLERTFGTSQNEKADNQKQIAELRNQLSAIKGQMLGISSQLTDLHVQYAPVSYQRVEEMPKYPGGEIEMMNFIKSTLKYPVTAQARGIKGSALVLFIVDRNGKIVNAVVTNEIDPLLSTEVLRVIKKMPDWTPGRQGGKAVNVACTIPIRFILRLGFEQPDEERSFLKGDFPEVVVVGFGMGKPSSTIETKSSENSLVDPVNFFNKLSESGNNPVCLFDDKVISLEDIKKLAVQKPSLIDEITVLDDKAAIKMFGDKGKNGAIVATSKNKGSGTEAKLAKISWVGIGVQKKDQPYYFGPPQTEEEQPFVVVEQMPQFPGGEKAMLEFIRENLRFPNDAKKKNIRKATVIISFLIDKEGKIKNPKVMRSPDESLSEEAVRVIKLMPDWIPGKKGGKTVPVLYTLPIKFVLPETA